MPSTEQTVEKPNKILKAMSRTLIFIVMLLLVYGMVQIGLMLMASKASASTMLHPASVTMQQKQVNQRLDRIMDHAYPKLHPEKREKYRKSIIKWSSEYNLCPITVASIIWKESKFDEKCKYLGALGPMQTIPRYHKQRMASAGISVGDICTIDKGVQIGCIVFKHYLDKSNGNVTMALKRYNGCVNAKNPKYVRDILNMRDKSKRDS
jgi:soluble lytic murein transglycosylase-like protein